MLTNIHWLAIACWAIFCLQAVQLNQLKSTLAQNAILLSIPILTWLGSDVVSRQSMVNAQSILSAQLETLQIVVLLEAALLCFTRYKLPVISSFIALFYGQLFVFQSGLLSHSFAIQGALYGVGIATLIWLNIRLCQHEPLWPKAIFATFLLTTYLAADRVSASSELTVNQHEMWASLAVIAVIVCLGFMFQRVMSRKLK